eukprot:TRINITY_DN55052_c0_g1_i1.p1 TRINITY_DN55052_c0_g1~~TRINITY_DN55052_c0_g1_i1.p1  ORF type:complete len:496 (+),score=175.79 TRINITY_DN55052_c0_g1_i1:95-1582(+)
MADAPDMSKTPAVPSLEGSGGGGGSAAAPSIGSESLSSSRRRSLGGRRRSGRPPPLQIDPSKNLTDDEEYSPVNDTDWVPMQSRSQGRPYYYHTETKETVWEKPDDFDESLPEGKAGWVEMESRTQGRWYYYNSVTKECVWERPDGVPEPPPFERRTLDPRREYLKDQIAAWADEFYEEHGREPGQDDMPAGSEIAKMHRDYTMLKDEVEYEKLKQEQGELRNQLDPDSRDRLREIKERLDEIEDPVLAWRETKEQERARREEVTSAYNGWIKQFSDEHGRPPTEKDIPAGSKIAEMFQEYTKFREAARQAKQRQAKIDERKQRQQNHQDKLKLSAFMVQFTQKHGREPTRADLEPGSEIERLYDDFLSRLPADSPQVRRDRLMKELTHWIADFKKKNGGRAPTKRDIARDPDAARLQRDIDALSGKDVGRTSSKKRNLGGSGGRPQPQRLSGTQGAPRDEDPWHEDSSPSPKAGHYEHKHGSGNPGCADCCVVS